MKKKYVTFLLVCMTIACLTGCGTGKSNGTESTDANAGYAVESDTEIVESSNEESETGEESAELAKSATIEYNVEDYVTLGDYMDVEVSINESDYTVSEEVIHSYIDEMISYYKPFIADESKTVVEKGDIVDVDYVGKKDGVAFDGGSAQGQMIDTASNADATSGNGYIEGFSDALIGAKVGDVVDSEVTFPEDYSAEDLKGQTVTFTFTINSINTKVTRDTMDDAYVKENFQSESVDAFYQEVQSFLEMQAEYSKENDIRSAVVDAVTNKCTVTQIPEGLLDARLEEYIESFTNQYCTDGIELGQFLQSVYGITEDEFREQNRIYMEQTLVQELVFEAIVKKENIEFDQEKFDEYMESIMQAGGFSSKDEVYEYYSVNKESGKLYMEKIYLQNEACGKIAEQAKINYITDSAESTEEAAE